MDYFNIDESFPCVITPKKPISNFQDLAETLPHYKSTLEQLLLKHGALLFRGFPLHSDDHFAEFIEAINLGQLVNYVGGDSPRDVVKNKVYTSTDAPPEIHLPLHQELSYIKYFPKHIYFYCDVAPAAKGETIIADAREVYKNLNPDVIERFQNKNLTYVSHYYHESKIMKLLNQFKRSHKTWMEVFETNDKTEVEKRCLENDIVWKWLRNDWVELMQTRPALLTHPITKETVWFNQAHLYDFNPKLLGTMRYLAASLFYFRPSTRLHEIKFADGSKVPRKDLYHILDTLQNQTVYYPWKKGDVMVLDNILAMHGRAPFEGKRRILTALTK